MPRLSFRIPLRFLRGSYSRLALTVIALACGVALVCAIDLVNRAVLRAFMEVIDTMAGRAALQVTAGGSGLFPEEVAKTVASVPGVELAVPVVSATAFTTDESGEQLSVHGIDLTDNEILKVYESSDLELDDALAFLNQADSVLMTKTFAEQKGLQIGDRVPLETPLGRKSFTIRGLLDPQGVARAYGGSLVIMDLFAAEASFTEPGLVNRIDVVVAREGDLDKIRRAVAAALPQGLSLELPAQRKANLHKAIESLQLLLRAVGIVALVAAFLIAFNRLSSIFEARAWQMGALRAVGLTSLSVFVELLKESLMLGSAGIALGLPLGVLLAKILQPVIATTTSLNYKVVVPDTQVQLDWLSVLLASSLGIVAAVSAAVLPAWRVAQVSPMEAIRGRGIEIPNQSSTPLYALRITMIVALAGALCLQFATRRVAWGLVATALMVVVTSLAARPLVERLDRSWLNRVWRAFGPSGRFAAAFVRLNPRRTARTAAMLGVGLGSVLWLGVIAHSFRYSAVANLGQAMQADLIVSSAHVSSGYLEVPVSDALLARLRSVSGVAGALGVRVTDWQYKGGEIALDAFDPEYFRDRRYGEWPLLEAEASPEDVWAAVARGDGIVVSSNFVLNLGARLGDLVELQSPRGPLGLRVVGVTTDFASPRGTVEMSRDVYRRYWLDSQITRAFVRASPAADHQKVRAAIVRTLGSEYRLRVISSGELLQYFTSQIGRAFTPLDVLAAMVLLVVLVGMSDTIAAGIVERTHDLGAMRAIGAQRSDLRKLAVLEALLPGGIGCLLAVASGVSLGALWVESTFPYLLGWVLELRIPWGQLGGTAILALAVCVVGALLPAMRAARLEVGDALRYE